VVSISRYLPRSRDTNDTHHRRAAPARVSLCEW